MAFEVVGDVLGDVDGDVLGDDVDGEVIGVATSKGKLLRLPKRPSWRHGQLAPGVMAPQEGLIPLPMTAQAGSPPGTFTSLIPAITFQGQLQKPFRGERVLVAPVRTGPTAVGRLLTQIFVGVDLQQAEVTGFDLELIGVSTAFGTRLTLMQAPPGVLIRMLITLSSGLTAPDTIFATIPPMI